MTLNQVHTAVALILSSKDENQWFNISYNITKTTNYKDNTDKKVSSGGTRITKNPSHRFSGGAATHLSHLPSTHM